MSLGPTSPLLSRSQINVTTVDAEMASGEDSEETLEFEKVESDGARPRQTEPPVKTSWTRGCSLESGGGGTMLREVLVCLQSPKAGVEFVNKQIRKA